MNILFSHFGIIYKGGFNRPFNLARGLAKLGHNVVIFTCQNQFKNFPYIKYYKDGVIIYAFPDILPKILTSKGYGFLSIILKILQIKKMKFNVVISDAGHRPSSGYPCYFAKKYHNSLYISEWWDYYGKEGQFNSKSFLFKFFLGKYECKAEIKNKIKADIVVVLSELTKKRAISLGIDPNKIFKIHGGADTEHILLKSKIDFNRNNYKLLIGYIATCEEDIKNINELIKVLNDSFIAKNVLLIIYGYKLSKDKKKKLFKFNNVYEYGWIDYFKEGEKLLIPDIYVLLNEDNLINNAGWPNKFGDYLACGKPILANLYGELKEFYTKYSKGVIPVEINEHSIKNKLLDILNGKYDLASMGLYNLNLAINDYSWDTKAKEYELIILSNFER